MTRRNLGAREKKFFREPFPKNFFQKNFEKIFEFFFKKILKRFLNFFSKKFGLRKIKIGASEKTFFREVFPNFFSKRFSKFFGNTSRKNILQNAFGFFLDHFQENIDTGCYKWAHICSTCTCVCWIFKSGIKYTGFIPTRSYACHPNNQDSHF